MDQQEQARFLKAIRRPGNPPVTNPRYRFKHDIEIRLKTFGIRIIVFKRNPLLAAAGVTPSGHHRGVSWHKASGKWRARLGDVHLGVFDTEADAAAAAAKARLNRRNLENT
jgi:AP2 domain